MATTTYTVRRRRDQCVRCPHYTAHTLCPACRTRANAYNQARRSAAREQPGPNVLYCCGQAHPITALPFTAPCCGRVLGEPKEAK